MTEQKQKSKNIFQIVFPNTYDLEFRAESVKLGLIPDEEKVRQLKAEMYRFARCGRSVDDHVKALNVLLRSREVDDKRPYTWGEQLMSLFSAFLGIGFTTLVFIFLTHIFCLRINSQMCRDTTAFSSNVVRYVIDIPLKGVK